MLEDITIRKGSFEEVLKIGNQIPEFSDPISIDDYRERIKDHLSLILVAYDKDIPVGFKIGYDRWEDGSFYSWLGGVLPAYRNQGIARNRPQQKILKDFVRHMEEDGHEEYDPPVPAELEASIRIRERSTWLPWEAEAIRKIERWRKNVSAISLRLQGTITLPKRSKSAPRKPRQF